MTKTSPLFGRLMRHIVRSPDTIITVVAIPVAILMLFVFVFGGAIRTSLGEQVSYINYVLPGILLMTIASGTAYTALRLFTDVHTGMFQRFASMPIPHSAALWAHVLTSCASNLFSVAIIFIVALTMGFRSGAEIWQWLAVIGILTLFTLTLTLIAVVPGLSAKTIEGASAFSYPLIFLPFISSAFVPTQTMPAPIRWFAENQPVTSIVNSIRALLNAQSPGNDLWIACAWCIGLGVVFWVLAMIKYRHLH
jgi:ABC-2 type transport system permease protein